MKVMKEYDNLNFEVIEVKSCRYAGDYTLSIHFNDGSRRLVDFKPFLESSLHPSIRKYLDIEKFRQVEIVDGNLNWNDYELIFPVKDLYDGKIS